MMNHPGSAGPRMAHTPMAHSKLGQAPGAASSFAAHQNSATMLSMPQGDAVTLAEQRSAPSKLAAQQGAALLMAMLTVALVATLAAAGVWLQWRSIEVEAAERQRGQAHWLLLGALDWSRIILREDARAGGENGQDHLAEPWAVPLQEARLSTFVSSNAEGVSRDDERVADLAELSDGEVVLYAVDGKLPAIQEHRAKGGRAVFLQGGAAVLAQGQSETSAANVEALLKRFGANAARVYGIEDKYERRATASRVHA